MELLLTWILCAVLALSESMSIKSKRQRGEAWMIKSNLLGDEFNTLEVEKIDTPTERSVIERPKKENIQANLKRPTREPDGTITNGYQRAKTDLNDKKSTLKTSFPNVKASDKTDESYFVKIDDQDATDSVVGQKRGLNQASLPEHKRNDVLGKKFKDSNSGNRKLNNSTIKIRQEIESNPETFAGQNIGRPYGDPEGYQTIGDGIFMMSTEQEAAVMPEITGPNPQVLEPFYKSDGVKSISKTLEKDNVKTATAKGMPEPSAASLPEILTNLDKENTTKAINNSGNSAINGKQLPSSKSDTEDKDIKTPPASFSSSNEPPSDMESMTPVEMTALKSFEDKLGNEDKVIGKIILDKKVDKGQQEFIEKTNSMLQKENQNQIDKIVGKFKEEESAFIRKNPYVVNKPELLGKLENVSYHDVGATKRGFLGTNDNLRVEKMYDSLLKEDELISKGLNPKTRASVRKAIARHKSKPEDAQVNEFLKFLENEDKENGDGEVDDGLSIIEKLAKPKKKHKKLKSALKNSHVLIIEPSLGVLSDTNSADGLPQLKDSDLKNMLVVKSKKRKKIRNSRGRNNLKKISGAHSKEEINERKSHKTSNIREKQQSSKDPVKQSAGPIQSQLKSFNVKPDMKKNTTKPSETKKVAQKTVSEHRKIPSSDGVPSKNTVQMKIKILEMKPSKSDSKGEKSDSSFRKNIAKDIKNIQAKGKKKNKHEKYLQSRSKNLKMEEGALSKELFVSPRKGLESKHGKLEKDDKDYYWHGTVKPETREFPTDPAEQIRKFGRISNITPVSFEPAAPEGVGEVIGDMNNIASVGSPIKTNEFEDSSDSPANEALKVYGMGISKASKESKPMINKIDENDISSTSFFSASKQRKDTYKQIAKQGIDPIAQKLMGAALNQIDSKDMQKVKGFVDSDNSKVMAMFDENSMKPKIEEFDNSNFKGNDNDDIGNADYGNDNYDSDDEPKRKHGRAHKKHKMKIVIHLPENIDGGMQEIHGGDSEAPIGTIKDISSEFAKPVKKPGLGQELADDDEDTLEEVLSKPTGKLEQFRPETTASAADYVPESIQGKESNEWGGKDGQEYEKEAMRIELNDQGKERNDNSLVDTTKSNNLLAMIKTNEDLLQKALGRHGADEDGGRFVAKAKEEDDGELENKIHETGQAKSVASKKKGRKISNGKDSSKNDKAQDKDSNYEQTEGNEASSNIFADQLNYEQKSKEVSQVMPTETVNQVKEIFEADSHLMPENFLLEDQKALGKPGIGPLAKNNKKFPTMIKNKPNAVATTENKLSPINSHLHAAHKLQIQGGKIHGGDITGGFISGGEINGGNIQGGTITGGRILGGTFRNGKMENGTLYNGVVDGGLIKGGSIYGGKIEDGLVQGGTIRGGEVDGGKVTGGEIDGGFLKSGEIRGGLLKSGSVEGGVLKGGSIEGGHLLGGIMLGGKLKGGVVRSGVIRGGIIEGGIVNGGIIEDGVVIKGGVVKGELPHDSTVAFSDNFEADVAELNKEAETTEKKSPENELKSTSSKETASKKTKDETANDVASKDETSKKSEQNLKKEEQKSEPKETKESSKNNPNKDVSSVAGPTTEPVKRPKATSAQMYKINVDQTTQDHNVEPLPENDVSKVGNEQEQKQPGDKPSDFSILGAPESWPMEGKSSGKLTDPDKQKVAPATYSNDAKQKQKPVASKPQPYQEESSKLKDIKTFQNGFGKGKKENSEIQEQEFTQLAKDDSNAAQKSLMMRSPTQASFNLARSNDFAKNYGTTTRTKIDKRPAVLKYHWSLNSVNGGKILGSPGKSMAVIGGIKVHSGVATLNEGLDRGYLDAGDYQGECVSDPDVCKRGLTLSFTSKIFKDSAESPTRMYLFDSGAGSEDSRGMALWVNRGKIEGAVSSRKGTWCLEEDIGKFQDRWVDYVLTWHPIRGLYLYANCELLAVSGFGTGCDICSRSSCHQEDKNTHLMFGRPNKGPHFKLTHFSSGDISIYEDFFNNDGVNELCGTNNDYLKTSALAKQRLYANYPVKSPLHLGAYVMKKGVLSKTAPEFNVPSVDNSAKIVGNEFEVWPTPSGLQSLSALFQASSAPEKPAVREKIKVDGGYSEWSDWTSCIGACGGTSMSTRYCNNPVPKNGGQDCSVLGPARRTRTCDETNCLAPESLKALARLQSETSSMIESDISKRKEISKAKHEVDQKKDMDTLKEELNELAAR